MRLAAMKTFRDKSPGAHMGAWILLLVLATIVIYWRVGDFPFVGYDDDLYITENPQVRQGLSWANVRWAFATSHAANWHPLTWLSHMADVEAFGSATAGGHHIVNLLLHLANSLLLFLTLRRMTGAVGRSGFAAMLFAVHPLHVESVAWVAERKDVLSTLFMMLALWTYVRYVERPGIRRYLVVILSFALGLLSKPMLVTLPFALLLVDFWPLKRFGTSFPPRAPSARESSAGRILVEKIPLLALSLASSAITYAVQSGTVRSIRVPVWDRVANASVSYMAYLWKTICPVSLSVFYPHPASVGAAIPIWQVAASIAALAIVSALAVWRRRNVPWLATGWFWYLGTLVPVLGLVQVGGQAMADRYTYVPLIGVFIVAAWGIPELGARLGLRKEILWAAGAAAAAALAATSWLQVSHWRSSTALFEHAIASSPNNWLAHNNLAFELVAQGDNDGAIRHYEEAIRIRPGYAQAHENLGILLMKTGRTEQALAHLREMRRLIPQDPSGMMALGNALFAVGKTDEAVAQYRDALAVRPDGIEVRYNLAEALARAGRYSEAIAELRDVVRLQPLFAEAHNNLGYYLLRTGKTDEAIEQFREALRLNPGDALAKGNLQRALLLRAR